MNANLLRFVALAFPVRPTHLRPYNVLRRLVLSILLLPALYLGSARANVPGLVLHYPLDERSGMVASDSTGVYPATLAGFSSTPWTTGMVGLRSLSFDGTSAYVSTPIVNTGTSFSFSTWVWVATGGTGLHNIVANSPAGSASDGFRLSVCGSANANAGRIQLDTGNGVAANSASTSVGAMPFTQWTHLVVTVDRSMGIARIFVNGIERTVDTSIRTDFNSSAPLTLGAVSGGGNFLAGGMDDFRLYGQILGGPDMDELRDLSDSPFAQWRLNNTTANAMESGRPVTLSATGAAFNGDVSIEGAGSLDLDGTGYATAPSLDVGSTFTFALWVRRTGTGASTLLANSYGGTFSGYVFYINAVGKIVFYTGNGTVANSAMSASDLFINDQWNHVAVTVDRAAGTAQIYYNGEPVATDSSICTDFTTKQALYIGRMINSNNFADQLDAIRLYPRELTTNEIRVLATGKLLAHWRFEATGEDQSGFDRTATLRNGADYSTTDSARDAASLQLNGVSGGANDHATAAAFDQGDQFSISMWVRANASRKQALLGNSYGGTYPGYVLYTGSSGALTFTTGNGTAERACSSPDGVFEPNQWNHVAVVVDRSLGTATVYYNRSMVASGAIRNDFASNSSVYIGRMINSSNFDGRIDDVRIYAKKLTDGDVAALGAGCPNTPPTITALDSSTTLAVTGTTVSFTVAASDANLGDNLQYSFDFGDGTPPTPWSSSNSITHTFSELGRYTVTVFVSDGVATVSSTISQVVYAAPVMEPTAPGNIVFDARQPLQTFQGFGVNCWAGEVEMDRICSELGIQFARVWFSVRGPVPTTDTVEAYQQWWAGVPARANLGTTLQVCGTYGVKSVLTMNPVPTEWRDGSAGTHLRTDRHGSFARLWVAIVLDAIAQGYAVHGIELYNEPDGDWSTNVTAAENADVVKVVRAELDAQGLTNILIVGPGTSHCGWDYATGDPYVLALDQVAVGSLGAWSNHMWEWGTGGYIEDMDPFLQRQYLLIHWPDEMDSIQLQDPQFQKPIYVTEVGVAATKFHGQPWENFVGTGQTRADALPYGIRNTEHALMLANNGANALLFWEAVDQSWSSDKLGLLRGAVAGYSARSAYEALRGFSPDIPADARMLTISQSDPVLYAAAFGNATRIVVVVTNGGEVSASATLGITSDSHWHVTKAQQFVNGILGNTTVPWDSQTDQVTLPTLPVDSMLSFVLEKN